MLSVAQLRQDRKPESAHRLVHKRHAHALESNETVTGGSRVKAGCVSDTLHLNQLLPSCWSTAPWSFYIHDKLMERAWLQIRKRSGFCFSCMTLLFLTFTPVFRFFILLLLLFCVSAVFWVWRLSASHARVKTGREADGATQMWDYVLHVQKNRQHAGGGAHDPQPGLLTGWDTVRAE